jgi:phosphinothricin acetyltransferase
MAQQLKSRAAVPQDAPAIAAIYNEGIAERIATFETHPRTAGDIAAWLGSRFPVVVVESHGVVVGFASTSTYRSRDCYAGIAEFSVYVARVARRRGVARLAMTALMKAAERAGFWKLVSRIFVENTASRALMAGLGFREVGVYQRHAQLDGRWRDVVVVERLLGPPHQPRRTPPVEAVATVSNHIAALARFYQLRDRDRVCRRGLTVSECYALEAIVERGGVGITELARHLGLNKSSASRAADRLIGAGLAKDGKAPNGRSRRVVATAKGRTLCATIHGEIQREHRDALGPFDSAALEQCARVLHTIAGRRR